MKSREFILIELLVYLITYLTVIKRAKGGEKLINFLLFYS